MKIKSVCHGQNVAETASNAGLSDSHLHCLLLLTT